MALDDQDDIRISVIVYILKRNRSQFFHRLPHFSRIAVICFQLVRLVQNLPGSIRDKYRQSVVPCIQCRIEPDFIPGFLCRIYGFLRKFLQRHRKDLILQQAESLVLQIPNLFYPVKAFPVSFVLLRHQFSVFPGRSHRKRKGGKLRR